jgi:hypothetical protein
MKRTSISGNNCPGSWSRRHVTRITTRLSALLSKTLPETAQEPRRFRLFMGRIESSEVARITNRKHEM